MRRTLPSLIVLASLLIPACGRSTPSGPASQAPAPPPTAETFRRLSERIDPWVARPRVVVMTDIANEPDDQMSMVRLLVYSNEVEIEGLIATHLDLDAQPRPPGGHQPGASRVCRRLPDAVAARRRVP